MVMAKIVESPLRQAVRACREHFIPIAIFSALLNILYLAPTIYMLQVYGRALPSRGLATLAFLTLIFLLATSALSALDGVRSRLLVRASLRLDRLISPAILGSLIARRERQPNAQALRDFDMLRNTLTGPGVLALFDAPWTPIYILICFLIHPLLGCFAMAGSIVLIVIAVFNERSVKEPLLRASAFGARAFASLDHTAAVGGAARALGMRRALVRKHLMERETSSNASAQANFASSGYFTLTKFARLTMQSLALGIGVFLAIEQKVSPGEIFAASLLVTRALSPIEQLVGAWKNLAQAKNAWSSVQSLLLAHPAKEDKTLLPKPTGHVSIEHLSVLTTARDKFIINDITFNVEPGEVLGIIGPSGAGKSTLVRAICGATAYSNGAARFDGAELHDWDEEQIFQNIGYCPQEPNLFAGSIRENIARFRNELGGDLQEIDAAAIRASQACGAHQMIVRLPNGYETMLGLGGSGLSAGQAQRVALARALFGEPRIIIMDEPNAHLDANGEQELLAALLALKRQGATIILVAHRASVLSAIDRLMFLRDGRIELLGPRDDVLQRLAAAEKTQAAPESPVAAPPPTASAPLGANVDNVTGDQSGE
jgi:PrtD family type I secretion system ABC transporter